MKKLILITFILGIVLNSYSQETGTYTDTLVGKVYKTVKIGTQWWFAENMAYISNETTLEGLWVYDCDTLDADVAKLKTNYKTYGVLYDYEWARYVCPVGWHLPTEKEWLTLTDFLGGEKDAGIKLKESGSTHWESSKYVATNSSLFNALPAGYYDDLNQKFKGLGKECYYWSADSEDKTSKGYYHKLFFNSNRFKSGERGPMMNGYSVRCIKDNE